MMRMHKKYERWVHVIDSNGDHVDCQSMLIYPHRAGGGGHTVVYHGRNVYVTKSVSHYGVCNNFDLFLNSDYSIGVRKG